MKRLTYRDSWSGEAHRDWSGDNCTNIPIDDRPIIEKLCEYEDTGFEPGQINEMAKTIEKQRQKILDLEFKLEMEYEAQLEDL